MNCPECLRPFNRTQVAITWMLVAGVVSAAVVWVLR
jgi:hypothetical protein